MPELKPCPFCGGTASYTQTGTGFDSHSAYFDFRISCRKCGAIVPGSRGRIMIGLSSGGDLNVLKDERAAAKEAWNRRSDDA